MLKPARVDHALFGTFSSGLTSLKLLSEPVIIDQEPVDLNSLLEMNHRLARVFDTWNPD